MHLRKDAALDANGMRPPTSTATIGVKAPAVDQNKDEAKATAGTNSSASAAAAFGAFERIKTQVIILTPLIRAACAKPCIESIRRMSQ